MRYVPCLPPHLPRPHRSLRIGARGERRRGDAAVAVLGDLDAFYDDRSQTTGSVLTELVLALAEPSPRDPAVIDELPRYKGLDPKWHEWSSVVAACQSLALDLSGAR